MQNRHVAKAAVNLKLSRKRDWVGDIEIQPKGSIESCTSNVKHLVVRLSIHCIIIFILLHNIKIESNDYTDASIHVHTCLTDFFDLQMLY